MTRTPPDTTPPPSTPSPGDRDPDYKEVDALGSRRRLLPGSEFTTPSNRSGRSNGEKVSSETRAELVELYKTQYPENPPRCLITRITRNCQLAHIVRSAESPEMVSATSYSMLLQLIPPIS